MHRLRRVVLIITWSALFVLCFLNIENPDDFSGFVAFGRAANDGMVVYDPAVQATYLGPDSGFWATWPPGFAPLASVLAWMDGIAHGPTVVLFQFLNLVMLAVTLLVTAEWLTGRKPLASEPENRIAWDDPVTAVALLVPVRLVVSNFEHVQVNLLILGLVVLGVRLLESRRWVGGLLFGVGSAMKATPILLVLYLLWRGRWRDLGAALAGAFVGWIALPALVLGPGAVGTWWRAWIGALPRAGSQDAWMNQSLRSVAVLNFGPEIGVQIWIVGTLLLAIAILVAFARPFRSVHSRRAAAEVAVLLAAITIVSPVAWKAHYVTLVPLSAAVFVFAHGVGHRRRRVALIGLAIVAVGINLTPSDLIGRPASVLLQEYGIVLWMGLLLVTLALGLIRSVAPGVRVADQERGASGPSPVNRLA